MRAAGVQGRAQVGLLQVHPRRALRLQADAAQRIRRSDGAGEPLGPRRPSQRALVREADLPRLAEQTAPPCCSPGKEVLMRLIRLTSALLLLGVAACSTTPGDSSSLLIDQPTAPFPYNSRICP